MIRRGESVGSAADTAGDRAKGGSGAAEADTVGSETVAAGPSDDAAASAKTTVFRRSEILGTPGADERRDGPGGGRVPSEHQGAESGEAARDSVDDGAGDKTVVMRIVPAGTDPATRPGDAKSTGQPGDARQGGPVPGSDDKTVAMPIVTNPVDPPTMAMPIQVPPDQQATQRIQRPGTDRVVPPRQGPLSRPPTTPRPAPGPKKPGQQGPSGPQGPQGPGGYDDVEQTRPTPPRPPATQRPPVPKAPSPADVQMTLPVQSTNAPRETAYPPQPRPMASPQRIAPPAQPPAEPAPVEQAAGGGKSTRWLLAVGAAAVVLIAVLAAIAFSLVGSSDSSPESAVRAAIGEYTDALRDGDLATLRTSTCGPLHDFYIGLPEQQFAGVHRLSMERKNIPVVDSVDKISITGDTAIAQATVYTDADPTNRSARTFDLERTDAGWKVCDPSTGTP
ncbi:Rv0361 family membrane protein [Nocardia aurea]|uniref:Rv0361 family membrane protein n=1 Tax=Nocardia aurea TaxID=2144174 RepID=UPI0033A183B2